MRETGTVEAHEARQSNRILLLALLMLKDSRTRYDQHV